MPRALCGRLQAPPPFRCRGTMPVGRGPPLLEDLERRRDSSVIEVTQLYGRFRDGSGRRDSESDRRMPLAPMPGSPRSLLEFPSSPRPALAQPAVEAGILRVLLPLRIFLVQPRLLVGERNFLPPDIQVLDLSADVERVAVGDEQVRRICRARRSRSYRRRPRSRRG